MLDVDAVLVNIRTNNNLHNNQIFFGSIYEPWYVQ